MKVYCSHSIKRFTKGSNFYQCLLCPVGWYGSDPVPLVIIGETDADQIQVPRKEKDLSKKRFKRCTWCHDTIEKRSHWTCEFWRRMDKVTIGPAPEKPKR